MPHCCSKHNEEISSYCCNENEQARRTMGSIWEKEVNSFNARLFLCDQRSDLSSPEMERKFFVRANQGAATSLSESSWDVDIALWLKGTCFQRHTGSWLQRLPLDWSDALLEHGKLHLLPWSCHTKRRLISSVPSTALTAIISTAGSISSQSISKRPASWSNIESLYAIWSGSVSRYIWCAVFIGYWRLGWLFQDRLVSMHRPKA